MLRVPVQVYCLIYGASLVGDLVAQGLVAMAECGRKATVVLGYVLEWGGLGCVLK